MNEDFRLYLQIRTKGGTIFNSEKYCTEPFRLIVNSESVEAIAHEMATDIEIWLIENLNAAEEFGDASN